LYDNYTKIAEKAKRFEEFTGNSMYSRVYIDQHGTEEYNVYSYRTIIARVIRGRGVFSVELNTRKYSRTTSKQQTVLRRAWADLDFVEMSDVRPNPRWTY
jgi:hypothetical protein